MNIEFTDEQLTTNRRAIQDAIMIMEEKVKQLGIQQQDAGTDVVLQEIRERVTKYKELLSFLSKETQCPTPQSQSSTG